MEEKNFLVRLFNRQLISPIATRIIRTFMVIIWILLFILLLWTTWKNRSQIAPLLFDMNYSNLWMVFIYYFLNVFATLLGWGGIVRSYKFSLSWWRNILIYCATFGLRRLPGTIWYVGGRIIIYQKLGISRMAILQSSVIELVVEFLSAGLVGLGIFLSSGFTIPDLLLIPTLIGLAIAMIMLFPRVIKRLFDNDSSYNIRNLHWLTPIAWILAYSFMWFMGGLMVNQLVSIVKPVDWRQTLFIVGAWSFSGMAGLLTIFLPTTFGASELSLTAFLSQILPLPLAGAIAISTRLLTFFMEVLLSVVFYPLLVKFHLNDIHIDDTH